MTDQKAEQIYSKLETPEERYRHLCAMAEQVLFDGLKDFASQSLALGISREDVNTVLNSSLPALNKRLESSRQTARMVAYADGTEH
jgi:hypothetical protein